MDLDLEYFKKYKGKKLQELKNMLYGFDEFSRWFWEELKEFNIKHGRKREGLLEVCHDVGPFFMLFLYLDSLNENVLSFCNKTNIEQLKDILNAIVNDLLKIQAHLSPIPHIKLNDLAVERLLINMQLFYNMLNDYITEEYKLLEA